MKRPTGYSKWRHRESGCECTALTIAQGEGPDEGAEFVYYLALDPASGGLTARVLRLDSWADVMRPEGGPGEDVLDELI